MLKRADPLGLHNFRLTLGCMLADHAQGNTAVLGMLSQLHRRHTALAENVGERERSDLSQRRHSAPFLRTRDLLFSVDAGGCS